MHGAFFICMVHFLFALYRRHAWRLYRMHGVSIIRMAHFLFARQYIIICTVQTPCMASLSHAWRIFHITLTFPVTTPSIKLILYSFNFSISCSFNEMAVAILAVAVSINSTICFCSERGGIAV